MNTVNKQVQIGAIMNAEVVALQKDFEFWL